MNIKNVIFPSFMQQFRILLSSKLDLHRINFELNNIQIPGFYNNDKFQLTIKKKIQDINKINNIELKGLTNLREIILLELTISLDILEAL